MQIRSKKKFKSSFMDLKFRNKLIEPILPRMMYGLFRSKKKYRVFSKETFNKLLKLNKEKKTINK